MDDLQIAASDVLDAVKANDSQMLAEVLKNFFLICDSQPHDEGESADAYGGEVSPQSSMAKSFGEKY